MKEPHISLPAEVITHFGFIPITNTIIVTWLIMFGLAMFAIIVNSQLFATPGKLQTSVELIIQRLYSFFESIIGKKIAVFFPLLATLFIFILLANWTELIPGISAITHEKIVHGERVSVHLLRAPTSDLNTTLALAIVAVFYIQWHGIKFLGINYLGKFFNLSNPISFFVGVLDIISEGSRLISFAFRLFGNIFAGQVLLTVVAFLLPIPLLVPLPFLGLELFVGLVQALVFSMLTAVFLNVATSKH